jgi:hypothetical protein
VQNLGPRRRRLELPPRWRLLARVDGLGTPLVASQGVSRWAVSRWAVSQQEDVQQRGVADPLLVGPWQLAFWRLLAPDQSS